MRRRLLVSAAFLLVLAACSVSPGASTSQPAKVTGTVTYLQRIALPNNARVTVQIQDVSKADAPATILGEQVIPTNGKQVPFAFEVSYDPSKIVPTGRYNLYARITDGDGKLRFITDTATPVINNGPTENVALTLVQVP